MTFYLIFKIFIDLLGLTISQNFNNIIKMDYKIKVNNSKFAQINKKKYL